MVPLGPVWVGSIQVRHGGWDAELTPFRVGSATSFASPLTKVGAALSFGIVSDMHAREGGWGVMSLASLPPGRMTRN